MWLGLGIYAVSAGQSVYMISAEIGGVRGAVLPQQGRTDMLRHCRQEGLRREGGPASPDVQHLLHTSNVY